ncbi:hypothetical protein [Clostridium sp.]|uniref:hypothetical protein n=1 Tax=Clostridium sp. TaxID=1506 RepID=UPI003F3A7304
MKDLILIELRKYGNKTTTITALSLIVFLMITSGIYYMYYDNTIVSSDGELVSGMGSFWKLKEEAEGLEGEVNQSYLDNIVSEFDGSIEKRDYVDDAGVYGMRFHIASYLLNFPADLNRTSNFSMDFDYDFLKSEEQFYLKYKEGMKEVIRLNQENITKNNNIDWFKYTTDQLEVIDAKIDSLEDNFYVEYTEGLQKVIYDYQKYFWVFLVAISFLLCGVFSKDSVGGIDELSLSSTYGRKKNMNAKVIAGNIVALCGYFLFVSVILFINGIFASLHGVNGSVQLYWRTCIYNLSIGQAILILFAMGLVVTILIANIILLLSIIIKYVKLSGLLSICSIYFMVEFAKTNNMLKLLINPIYTATNLKLDIPIFIGNVMIPYPLIAVAILIVYLISIRLLTILMYKRCTVRG